MVDSGKVQAGALNFKTWDKSKGSAPNTIEVWRTPGYVDYCWASAPSVSDELRQKFADAFIALALGAKGVFVGRPLFWGLAYDGADGVKFMLDILRSEFDRSLSYCGFKNVSEITRSAVNVPLSWDY